MGIEAGPSGVVAGSSFKAPTFEAVPVMAGRFISERPFRGSLEGFRPMNITDIKTIADANSGGTTGPSVEAKQSSVASTALARIEPVLNKQEVIEEAEHWLGITKQTIEPTYNLSSYGITITEEGRGTNLAKTEPAGVRAGVNEDIIEGTFRVLDETPLIEPVLHAGLATHPKTETKNETAKARTTYTSKREQVRSEQIIEEEKLSRKRYLVDKLALGNRILGIVQAVRKAKELVGVSKIPGRLINRFWTGEADPQNISEAVKPGNADGSIPEIREAIDSQTFDSEEDARRISILQAETKKPVKEAKADEDGEDPGQENIRRVFKFHLFMGVKAHEVVEKRTNTKVVPAPLMENIVSKAESRLEDYPDLAEVFK